MKIWSPNLGQEGPSCRIQKIVYVLDQEMAWRIIDVLISQSHTRGKRIKTEAERVVQKRIYEDIRD